MKNLASVKKIYLASLAGVKSDRTIAAYKTAVERFEKYIGAEKPVAEISSADVIGYRAALLRQGVKVNSVADYLNKLSIFFHFVERLGEIQKSPVSTDDIPKKQRVVYNLLNKEQIEQTIADAPEKLRGEHKKNRARNRAIILVLLCCGLRNSELRDLCLSDLDFEAGTVLVRNGKGNKTRTAPFPSVSQDAVREYLADGSRPPYLTHTAFLFGSCADERGHAKEGVWRKMSAVGLERIVGAYFGRTIGNEGLTPHALRHGAASLWDDLGVDMRDIQLSLGHASIRTTENIYVSVLNKSKSANAVNAAFARA